ncbi:MAG: aminotransferase class V-fold PLP-dependent enzyme [Collimonas sp.]|uniref:aminotransferase class V-fold PLP-dependent enzyme n=1 Tax=Collimonas sp. TaxID=1963772 RepID=UPI003263450F
MNFNYSDRKVFVRFDFSSDYDRHRKRSLSAALSFVLAGYKTEEVGAALNQQGIAVRSGHHGARPILRRFGVESTVRPSLAFYNNCADIDALIAALIQLRGARSGF